MVKPPLYFAEFDLTALPEQIIILDVDGTIVPHGAGAVDPEVIRRIEVARKEKRIFLCSNAPDCSRIVRIADSIGVSVLALRLRKPWGVLPVEFPRSNAILVFGDKLLTDGLFAWRIGARFIRVRRMVNGSEAFFDRCAFMLDDFLYFFKK